MGNFSKCYKDLHMTLTILLPGIYTNKLEYKQHKTCTQIHNSQIEKNNLIVHEWMTECIQWVTICNKRNKVLVNATTQRGPENTMLNEKQMGKTSHIIPFKQMFREAVYKEK